MSSEQLIPMLALFTLLAVLAIGVWQFAAFLRKRRNRDIASHALGFDESSDASATTRRDA